MSVQNAALKFQEYWERLKVSLGSGRKLFKAIFNSIRLCLGSLVAERVAVKLLPKPQGRQFKSDPGRLFSL
ncbi:MAG: hypothetical protein MAG795_00590 [Candidatus Woesearchaeota archaeon]|nr:hypothetical protein [Candidatus Woesearchaeota archaeon]